MTRFEPTPICAECFGVMQTVTVHHKHMPPTRHRICLGCLTGAELDRTDLPAVPGPWAANEQSARHLQVVR